MVLKVTCPSCAKAYRLTPPYPPAGKRYRCVCGAVITVSYPESITQVLAVGEAPAPISHGDSGTSVALEAARPADGVVGTPLSPEPRLPEVGEAPPAAAAAPDPQGEPAPREEEPLSQVSPGVTTADVSPPQDPPERAAPILPLAFAQPVSEAEPPPAPPPPPVVAAPPTSSGGAPPPSPSLAGRRWVRVAAATLVLLLVGGLVAGWALISSYSENLPSVESLRDYRPLGVTRVLAADGTVIGEYFEEYRDVVPIEKIPPHVVDAFLSSEDASFYEHGGIDYFGIVRAMVINLQEGRMAQGASTITQQVARSFLLTREKKLERKVREILLAYRIEANFEKDYILYLYLNQIFFGEGAYGVQAAAHIYFGKDVTELTIAEAALLAGLPQAPSAYNPVRNFSAARERQRYVLSNMVKNGKITQAQADEALAQQITLVGRVDVAAGPWASFSEHVRRTLVETYGHDKVYREALTVETTLDVDLQKAAAAAVQSGCRRTDRRIGWRGPLEHLEPAAFEAFLAQQVEARRLAPWKELAGGEDLHGPPPAAAPALKVGDVVKGIVVEVERGWAVVKLGPEELAWLSLERAKWAYPVNAKRNWKGRAQDDLRNAFKVGDVLQVEVREADPEKPIRPPKELEARPGFSSWVAVGLWQESEVEAAIFSYRMEDGGVVAMVGGRDFSRSEFNRAVQARRQTGSTFKPLVYASALDHPDKRYTASTLVMDAPLAMVKESSQGEEEAELWKPSNYAGDYMNEITFRKALILSRNTPTVRILDDVGVSWFYDYVTKYFGFESPLNRDLSMGLGSSSVTLLELSRAYSVFAHGGKRVEPRFVDRVLDRDGAVLEDNREKVVKTDAIRPQTAFIMTTLLQGVVCCGTGTGALALGKLTAGKTGTTNEFRDAWFMGYTPRLVTGAWTGFDDNRSLGFGQTGGDAVVPFWVDYMKAAIQKYPETEHRAPEKVKYVSVDSETGLLAADDSDRVVRVAFVEGTEPTQRAPSKGQVGTEDFFSTDGGGL